MKWYPDMKSAMITDDIAFIGGTPVSVHCFLSDDGLILLDSGYPGMLNGIAGNLNSIGLDIHDVRYVVHTHGHIDHYGSTAELVRMTGAKTFIGSEDAEIVTGKRDLSWAKELKLDNAESFIPDSTFRDGTVLNLGGRRIRCIHAPGHTEGTYAFFIETKVNGIPRIAAMHGGVGINSMSKEFLNSYGLPLSLRDDFRAGLHRLAHEQVDIVLGNHPDQNDTEEKLDHLNEKNNPFVDAGEWQRFLTACEKRLDDMLAQEL